MKIKWNLFNYSAWIVLLLTYILPSHNFGEFASEFGYPMPYLKIFNTKLNKTLLSSFSINILILLIDILIVYLIILYGQKLIFKIRMNKK